MYLLVKFGSQRSYGNGDINSYISSCVNALEKAELTVPVGYIKRFSKSGIPIYNSKVLDMADRKTRRRMQAIAERFAFSTNGITVL